MSNAVLSVARAENSPINMERVGGEVQGEPVDVREAGCLTGLATWICDCEDAGGFWKVFSYALRFFALVGSIITFIGVPLYILADREIVRIDLERDLASRGMLTPPGALAQEQGNAIVVRGERDALQNQAAQDAQTILDLRNKSTETNTTLIATREEIAGLKEQIQTLKRQDGGNLQVENAQLKEEVANLRAAVVGVAAADNEFSPLMTRMFGNRTPARAPVQSLVDALPPKHRRVLDDAMVGLRSPGKTSPSHPQPRGDYKA